MKKFFTILFDLLLLAGLAYFTVYVNRGIEIRGLYMDDLYMWSCYGEQSLVEFAFPIGTSTRFRPVYWLLTYLQMFIVGNDPSRFTAFNLAANMLLAFSVFYMAKKLSGHSLLGFLSGIAFLASRFAYYQIGQTLGFMETLAQFLALWMLYLLCLFLRERPQSRRNRCYYLALLCYFLLVFVHERYLGHILLFWFCLFEQLLMTRKGRKKEYMKSANGLLLWPAGVLAFVVAVRRVCIGKALPAGTGGTEVTETFEIAQVIRFVKDQVKYLFGINAGPEHLNGLPWENSPAEIQQMVLLSILLLLIIVALFGIVMLKRLILHKRPAEQRAFSEALALSLLFVMFIGLSIGCSSITIRVEMRWIYVSYAAALIFASYMIGEIGEGLLFRKARATEPRTSENPASGSRRRFGIFGLVAALCFAGYVFLSTETNMYYRTWFPKLYFWPDQLRMNSLADETIGRYGREGVFGKNIYILENSYGMSQFYADTFFKVFDEQKTAEGTNVSFAESLSDIDPAEITEGRALVIEEVPSANAYHDLTVELCERIEAGEAHGFDESIQDGADLSASADAGISEEGGSYETE